MKILLTGAGGQLGRELMEQGPARGLEFLAPPHSRLDVTDRAAALAAVGAGGLDLAVNAAAYTAVDDAESHADLALAVNRDGPANLAAACARAGLPLIHLSTDYVFDGQGTRPYRETDPASPLGAYGRSKAAGEERVRERLAEHLIVRTSWLYGVYGRNFVKTMLGLGRERAVLRVVNDQRGCPTYAADLAGVLIDVAVGLGEGIGPAWGTYHWCGLGVTTWYELARAAFSEAARHETFRLERIEPIPTSEYPTPAARPAYSALDSSRLSTWLGRRPPPWQEGLARMIDRYYALSGRLGHHVA
jgi:dTDP-4-dehydrorhamnose reductase